MLENKWGNLLWIWVEFSTQPIEMITGGHKLTCVTILMDLVQLDTKPNLPSLTIFIIHLSLYSRSHLPFFYYPSIPICKITISKSKRLLDNQAYWSRVIRRLFCFGFKENSLHSWQFILLPSYGIEWPACMHACMYVTLVDNSIHDLLKTNNVLTCARVCIRRKVANVNIAMPRGKWVWFHKIDRVTTVVIIRCSHRHLSNIAFIMLLTKRPTKKKLGPLLLSLVPYV